MAGGLLKSIPYPALVYRFTRQEAMARADDLKNQLLDQGQNTVARELCTLFDRQALLRASSR